MKSKPGVPAVQPSKEASKPIKAYSVIHKAGAYQIVELTIVDGVVTNVEERNEDILPITLAQLTTLIRRDLGL